MPVDEVVREKILNWIKNGKKYTEIMVLVEKEGQTITKGGITFIKKEAEKKAKLTKPTKQKIDVSKIFTGHSREKKPKFENALERQKPKDIVYTKLLSDLEFSNFEKSLEIVINSNTKRLKTAKAFGILNALNILKDTCKMIKKRGKY
ncbi:hypothetical protein ES702_02975 [subsurface metagenome]